MLSILDQYHIGRKTIQETKTELGIRSYRKMWKWYWHIDLHKENGRGTSECRTVTPENS